MKRPAVLLILVTTLGFLLRLSGLTLGQGYAFVKPSDEIEAYRVASRFLQGEESAQYLGQPNVSQTGENRGKVPGPLWALFWAIPMRLGGDVHTVMFLVLLLNTAMIPFVWLLAKRLFGEEFSLWAALFCATSPWAIYYSVGAWNPLVMAFLGVCLYLALWNVVQRARSPSIFWVCLLLAVMPHFHMAGVFLVPAVVLVLVLSANPVSKKWLTAGIVAAALIYTPYLRGEMAHDWENTRAILSAAGKPDWGVLKVFTTPVYMLSGIVNDWESKRFSDYRAFGDFMFGSFYIFLIPTIVSAILAVGFVVGFGRKVFHAFRGNWRTPRQAFQSSPAIVFFGILLAVPSIAFLFTGQGYRARYAIVSFGLLFVLPAVFMVTIPKTSTWRRWMTVIFTVVIVFHASLASLFFLEQGRRIESGNELIPSFRKMEMLYALLRADAVEPRRVRVDTAPLYSGPAQKIWAGNVLADYVALREELRPDAPQTAHEQIYLLKDAAAPLQNEERAIYRGNGVMLTALKTNDAENKNSGK